MVGLREVLLGANFTQTIRAATDVELWRIGKADLDAVVAQYPDVGLHLYAAATKQLTALTEELQACSDTLIPEQIGCQMGHPTARGKAASTNGFHLPWPAYLGTLISIMSSCMAKLWLRPRGACGPILLFCGLSNAMPSQRHWQDHMQVQLTEMSYACIHETYRCPLTLRICLSVMRCAAAYAGLKGVWH